MVAAFIDRADLVHLVREPDEAGIYSILRSCLLELMKCDLLPVMEIVSQQAAEVKRHDTEAVSTALLHASSRLAKSHASGRKIRRLVVLKYTTNIIELIQSL